jgi:hypothetical protein
MTRDELVRAWVQDLGVHASPEVLATARRRISAAGRLAQLRPLSHVGAIVRTEVLEHGGGPRPADASVRRVASRSCARSPTWGPSCGPRSSSTAGVRLT